MKRIKRTKDLEIILEIKNADFIQPPKESQRNSMVNTALKEFTNNLYALNGIAIDFVQGDTQTDLLDRTQKILSDEDIMEDWQIPIMQKMADVVTETHGDVLEIGFGRGIASDMIQHNNVSSHTIIECNDAIIKDKYYTWKNKYKNQNIKIVHGLWQDTIEALGLFDGIFFHTYPLNEDEYMNYVHASTTFAEHFFPTAAAHLKPGGVFTYFSNEIDSLSRSHQRSLFRHFSSFSLEKIDLGIPEDIKDTWWANTIVIVKAIK
ncbi:MAG: class I SAM-dependent methyltransferase [Flavobacteriaceae bacterium]|nr:MAG: class I SAM-dependent methyltransferase [Flavobacteriaceae bacterium]